MATGAFTTGLLQQAMQYQALLRCASDISLCCIQS